MKAPVAPFAVDAVGGARTVRRYFPTPSMGNVSSTSAANWPKMFFWGSMLVSAAVVAWCVISRFRDLYQGVAGGGKKQIAKGGPASSDGEKKGPNLADQYKLYD